MTSPEQRRMMREIVHWLDGDLFRRAPCPDGVNADTTTCFRSPLGWTVLLTPRKDGTGWAGEVRSPSGAVRVSTSWVDVPWLDEKIP